MQIVRDRPSAKLGYPILAPLWVTIDGVSTRADEWSLRGVVLHDRRDLPRGACLQAIVHLDFQGFEISLNAGLEAIEPGVFDFIDLSQRSKALLEQFVSDLMTGQMTSTDDVILRLDTPEDPISVKPDASKPEQTTRRFSLRPALMSIFYIVLGLVVFGYAGVLAHANFVKLEIQTAVVSRPLEVLTMPVDGRVAAMTASLGGEVAHGDLLAVVSNPDLDAKIDEQRVLLRSADAAVTRFEKIIEVEKARFAEYQVINETNALISDVEVSGLIEDKERTAQHLARIQQLHGKGFATQAKLEEALAADALAASRLRASRLMAAQSSALNEVSVRRHHNGREFVVDLDLLQIELTSAISNRNDAAARLAILLERKASLAISAPFNGRIIDVAHEADAVLLRGANVLTVEQNVPAVIEAFLNQEEVVQIGLGDPARIFLPSIDRSFSGRVRSIDRTTGFVDEQEAQYVWRGPQDRSARVVLEIEDRAAMAIKSGLPAIVLFDRRSTDTVRKDLMSHMSPAGDDV